MNELSCEIIKDLIPLAQDGVASQDSINAVEAHIKRCGSCGALYSGVCISDSKINRMFVKFRKKLRICIMLIMLACICIGVSCGLTDGGVYILANVILMPVIGILAYVVFHWKALFYVPPLVFGVFLLINTLVSDVNSFGIETVALLSFICCIAAVMGILISGLLHFAFGKDDGDGKNEKE